jgi:hypothetical protein
MGKKTTPFFLSLVLLFNIMVPTSAFADVTSDVTNPGSFDPTRTAATLCTTLDPTNGPWTYVPPSNTGPGNGAQTAAKCTQSATNTSYSQIQLIKTIEDNSFELEKGATALALFYYSMGRDSSGAVIPGGRDTCLSCDFVTYFIVALANFSAVLFMFFLDYFTYLAPVLMAIWIAIKVIQLNFNGGAGGGGFFMDMVKKFALFVVTWLFLTGSIGLNGPVTPGQQGNTYYAGDTWQLVGPDLLEFSFLLNSDVRTQTAEGLTGIGAGMVDSSPFECGRLAARVEELTGNDTIEPAVEQITRTACVIERMHSLGFATSVAMLQSAFYQAELTGFGVLNAIMMAIGGLFLLVVFGLSVVWLVFVLLDVVVKALIVAAFLPIFGIAYLFQPSRGIAKSAFMQLVAVPVVAFALGLTSLLGFYLITKAPSVYDNTKDIVGPYIKRQLLPIKDGDIITKFADFIQRIQQDPVLDTSIPTYVNSPWIIYMLLVGIGIFSLGKKIISIVENIMGLRGTTEMADNARKMAILGGGAAAVAGSMALTGGMMALKGAGMGVGAGAGAAGMGAGVLGKGMGAGQGASKFITGGGNLMQRSLRTENMKSRIRGLNPIPDWAKGGGKSSGEGEE